MSASTALPVGGAPAALSISDRDFARISAFIHRVAGIALGPAKKPLVAGRLYRRLDAVGAASYGAYLDHVERDPGGPEMQVAIDLLTTNETYFWREARHFELAGELARAAFAARRDFSVWSAACSSGEEVYTLSMVLEQARSGQPGGDWRVLGSDISSRVLQSARRGVYPLERAAQLPPALLKKYCLKGTGTQAGSLLIDRGLRDKVEFRQVNLTTPLPDLPRFDMIFLRNVMIYFDIATKRDVVGRLLSRLAPGGVFCVGLAETLNGIAGGLEGIGPGAYRKTA